MYENPRFPSYIARRLAPLLGYAWHAQAHSACVTGTADRSSLVPVEGPVQKACTSEECCVHSFCAGASVHDTDVAMMEDEHDIALFVLAELAWYHRQTCE